MTYRIGVLCATEAGDRWPSLAEQIMRAFAEADLILHLGGLAGSEQLRDLSTIAPVIALAGEHDRLPLPRETMIAVHGLRVALVHAVQPWYRSLPGQPGKTGALTWAANLLQHVNERFGDVNAVIFRRGPQPYMSWHENVFLFSPGMVCPPATGSHGAGVPGTLGILTLENGRIRAEVVPLSGTSEPELQAAAENYQS